MCRKHSDHLSHTFRTALVLGALLWAGGVGAQTPLPPAPGRLPTRWDRLVSPSNALPAYPRPQMTRRVWMNLNGLWDSALTGQDAPQPPPAFDSKILVPFPYESALSGAEKASIPDQRLWYRRAFAVPASWKGQRVLLHFGAVNWDSAVFLNGRSLGAHRGGYDPFDFDITDALKPGTNALVVSAWNPLFTDDLRGQVLGKQRRHPESIFYTAATGIWQTVWLEPVPEAHIAGLKIAPDLDRHTLHLTVQSLNSAGANVRVTAYDGARPVAHAAGAPGAILTLTVPRPHAWSPDDPHLYHLEVALVRGSRSMDRVGSYFAMRKISLGKDSQGRTRIFLNNKFLFQAGLLDQGYWPDGIYTAPTDDALRYDIQAARRCGYNMVRKHAKVEPERWYYWADKLGLLVWQDMPQAFGVLNDQAKAQWLTEWQREIVTHSNHPSIIVWTPFNEGWGQHDTEQIVALTRRLDPTRLIDAASGWVDKGVGDINDTHDYPGPKSNPPDPKRAAVNGEFGGITLEIPGHVWDRTIAPQSPADFRRTVLQFQELWRKVRTLEATLGISAVVYCQLIDTEREYNGMLTYDRAFLKLPAPEIARIVRGLSTSVSARNSAHVLQPRQRQ